MSQSERDRKKELQYHLNENLLDYVNLTHNLKWQHQNTREVYLIETFFSLNQIQSVVEFALILLLMSIQWFSHQQCSSRIATTDVYYSCDFFLFSCQLWFKLTNKLNCRENGNISETT